MRPAISIAIPQPCAQPWAAMSPTAAGRHCTACQTEVVDFTRMSDGEIQAYFKQTKAGSTCGRFAVGQLARPLRHAAPAPPTRWRAWLAAAVAVWGLREGAGVQTRAQMPTQQQPGSQPRADSSGLRPATTQPPGAPRALILRGTVTDRATGEPLPGVIVRLKGAVTSALATSTNTDFDGSFRLPVPEPLTKDLVTIEFVYLGYETRQVVWDGVKTELVVTMSEEHHELQGMAIISNRKKPWPWHPRRFYQWSKYWLTRPFRHR